MSAFPKLVAELDVWAEDGRSLSVWLRDDDAETGQKAWRHIGLYAFRCDYLQAFSQMSSCWLEQHESLERLRVLWHGGTISVYETDEDPGHGIDTQEDLLKVRRLFGDDTI